MPGDLRLRPDPLARGERGLEEPVQHRARRARLPREAQRLPDLAENLALPERHRVEPRCDAKEVARRLRALPLEARAAERRGLEPSPLRDVPHHAIARVVTLCEKPVDLAAVAGRDDDALGDDARGRRAGSQRFAHFVGGKTRSGRGRLFRHAEVPPEERRRSGLRGHGTAQRKVWEVDRKMFTTV